MKNRTIALFGIGTYILSVITSATDLEGNFRLPATLIVISGLLTLIFIVLATIRLWEKAKYISIILITSTIISSVLIVIQEITLSATGSIIFLSNIAKIIYLIAFFLAIIGLFKLKSEK